MLRAAANSAFRRNNGPRMFKAVAIIAAIASLGAYHSSIRPVPQAVKTQLVKVHEWHKGCPTSLSDLRVLTVTYRGFDGHNHRGQVVTNKAAAPKLATVFHRLYALHFRIHHMSIRETYGANGKPSKEPDPTGSFECRDAVPSPCSGGNSTGSWSNHAYGLAIDINPVENPYVGCGQSPHPPAPSYPDPPRHPPGLGTAGRGRGVPAGGGGGGGR